MQKTILMTLLLPVYLCGQCGPGQRLVPIGGGRSSCANTSQVVTKDRSGTVTIEATVPGAGIKLTSTAGILGPGLVPLSLRNWDAALARIAQSSGRAVIAWIGDSWTNNNSVVLPVRTALQAKYGNAGAGYIPFDSGSSAPNGTSKTRTGTWTDTFQTAGAYGLNAGHSTSSDAATPGRISVTATTTDFVVHYLVQPGGGSFTYSVDGGGTTTVSTAPVTNLLAQPNSFNQSPWAQVQATATPTIETVDPFGGANAWKLTEDATVNEHSLRQSVTRTGVEHTISVYAKAGERSLLVMTDRVTGAYQRVYYDLRNGTVARADAPATGKITPAAYGWYRCEFTFTSASGTQNMYFKPATNTTNDSYQGDGTSGIYLYGGQMETGATATPYSNGTPAYGTVAITGLANASHTLALTVTAAGAAGVTLMGAEANIDVSGVRVHRIPSTGASSATYRQIPAVTWLPGIAALAPDMVVLSLGINELLGNYSPASQAADFVTLASRVRAVLPNADILLVPPPDLGVTQTYSASQYAVAQRNAALANGWAFVDTPALFGPYSASSARGLWTNTTHVNALGGQVIANHVLNALRRGL